MSEATCSGCKHFSQHYALDNRRLFQVYCRSCTFSSLKRKYPDTSACEHFEPGISDQERFATKEYLSKELLQYVLNLELLPEIEEG